MTDGDRASLSHWLAVAPAWNDLKLVPDQYAADEQSESEAQLVLQAVGGVVEAGGGRRAVTRRAEFNRQADEFL
jgi:hypothetical protein